MFFSEIKYKIEDQGGKKLKKLLFKLKKSILIISSTVT